MVTGVRGAIDNASDCGSEGSGFDSWPGRLFILKVLINRKVRVYRVVITRRFPFQPFIFLSKLLAINPG